MATGWYGRSVAAASLTRLPRGICCGVCGLTGIVRIFLLRILQHMRHLRLNLQLGGGQVAVTALIVRTHAAIAREEGGEGQVAGVGLLSVASPS